MKIQNKIARQYYQLLLLLNNYYYTIVQKLTSLEPDFFKYYLARTKQDVTVKYYALFIYFIFFIFLSLDIKLLILGKNIKYWSTIYASGIMHSATPLYNLVIYLSHYPLI